MRSDREMSAPRPEVVSRSRSRQPKLLSQRPLRRQAGQDEAEQVWAVPKRVLNQAALFLTVLREAAGEGAELVDRQELPARGVGDAAEDAIIAREVGHLRLQMRRDG